MKEVTQNVLLGYWIHHKVNEATVEELDDPLTMRYWIEEYQCYTPLDMYQELCKLYKDKGFGKRYLPPPPVRNDSSAHPWRSPKKRTKSDHVEQEIIY